METRELMIREKENMDDTQEKMTMEQAEEEIRHFKKTFHKVRLFKRDDASDEAAGCRCQSGGEAGQCYDFWKRDKRCDNCVVQLAFTLHKQKSKLEVMDGKIYQVIARYIQIDNTPYVMELIRCLDNRWAVGELNHEKLVDVFVHYNDKLYKDAVTEAYNRRYYEEELKTRKENAGVALLDVDDFKLFNDTHGHAAGDVALHTVVEVIRKNIRKTDKLVRFGGDEFLLVMPDIEENAFIHKLQVIQNKIHEANVPGYPKLQLSISTGGVLCTGETIECAMNRADRLMYQAKIRKNMVVTERDEKNTESRKILKRQRILIVDDSEMNRAILIEMLNGDFEVLEAENGQEALDCLQQYGSGISLVLLDIMMPVMDGFEVLMQMNQKQWIEDIPVIMISSEESENCIRRAFKFGVSDYISRPFDSKVVYQRVFNTIKLYAKQRRLMTLVSDQIHEKEKNNKMMIEVLSQIVEFRNGESGLHVLHINILTKLLLEKLVEKTDQYQLSPADCHMIATASAFHDIGKIGIDEKILNKPGKLTKEEFEIMKTHTLIGASMLEKMEQYKDEKLIKIAYQICRWHHERYDGRGYPDGLKGEEIPIAAQVVSLADVYDALVSKRAYKAAFSHEKAMEMILGVECGTFNPMLLENLVEIQDRLRAEIH